MDQPNYFILRTSHNGARLHGPMTELDVLTKITPSKDGETFYGPDLKFLTSVPDLDSTERAILIIRGEIVVPKAVEVITKMTLP